MEKWEVLIPVFFLGVNTESSDLKGDNAAAEFAATDRVMRPKDGCGIWMIWLYNCLTTFFADQ